MEKKVFTRRNFKFKGISKILGKLKLNINRDFHKSQNLGVSALVHELLLTLLNIHLNQPHALAPLRGCQELKVTVKLLYTAEQRPDTGRGGRTIKNIFIMHLTHH